MVRKIMSLIAVLLCVGLSASAADQSALRLHLPRTVRIDKDSLTLGLIGVLRGEDAELVGKASSVAMGRAPWSGETIVIDRRTILSRLATVGIDAETVQITGAETVAVTRDETIVEAEQLVESARALLQRAGPAPAGCSWKLARCPSDLVVPAVEEFKLEPRLGKNPPKGYVSVEVASVSGERELGVARILFRLVYPARKAVATRDIAEGEILTQDNVEIRIVSVEGKPPQGWVSPYGMVARRAISAGREIRPSFAGAKKPEVLVKRNQRVQMKIEGMGFIVTALGTALQNGRAGELIRVRNVDTERIVTARVAFDGTVRPVYEQEVRYESSVTSD